MAVRRSEQRECIICYISIDISRGLECQGQGRHFICDTCFGGDNLIHQLSVESRGQFTSNGCSLVCQWCLPTVVAYSRRDLASHLSDEKFSSYQRACDEAVEARAFTLAEAQLEIRLNSMREELSRANEKQAVVQRHRLEICENVLTMKCPRPSCRTAIFMGSDFRACFALKCPSCLCDFCAWCFNVSSNAGENHSHVKVCALNPPAHRGSYDGTLEAFNIVHSSRRRLEVLEYIDQRVLSADREAVKEIMKKDLSDLLIAL